MFPGNKAVAVCTKYAAQISMSTGACQTPKNPKYEHRPNFLLYRVAGIKKL